jgi:hypothetical protein
MALIDLELLREVLMSGYTWITDPPVAEVARVDFPAVIGTFRANVGNYGNHLGTDEGAQQLGFIGEVLDAMLGCLADADAAASKCFVYRLVGQPVALMILSGGMSPKLDELTAHPGAEGAGTIMVEFAVNWSKAQGKEGRLILDSLNAKSTGFWTAMGFVKYAELPAQAAAGGCKMRLNPVGNAKWSNVGGKWRLKKYADQGLTHYSTTTKG